MSQMSIANFSKIGNLFGEEGAKAIAKVLKDSMTLRTLNLSGASSRFVTLTPTLTLSAP